MKKTRALVYELVAEKREKELRCFVEQAVLAPVLLSLGWSKDTRPRPVTLTPGVNPGASQPSASTGPAPAQVRPAGQRTSLREVAELTPEELAALPENSRREYIEFQSRATTSRSKRALANYEEKKANTQA